MGERERQRERDGEDDAREVCLIERISSFCTIAIMNRLQNKV